MAAAERAAAQVSIASYTRSDDSADASFDEHRRSASTRSRTASTCSSTRITSCPIVAVNLWYHVGSKNETPGRTGFAHLFEHLMFEGSEHHDKGYFQPLQGAGASLNGSTNADRTNYWEVVPTNALELALWMESDRMGYLLPALTDAKFENQRDVVLNERRQNYENRPYGLAPMAMLAALFPPDHPYHWPTIGEIADLHAATIDDVREFFRTYYHPANASLAIAGDIDPRRGARPGRAAISARSPAGPAVAPVQPADVMLAGERRLLLEDRVELPRLYLAWITPAMFAPDDAELDLAADLLANGKTSRLYRRLVYDERIATDVSAAQNSREVGGFFQVAATAAPGHSLAELERAIVDEIARLATDGPTADEIERGRVQAEAQFVFRLQTVGGFGGKSDQLNAYNVFVGDPDFFDRDLARYQRVTAESLQSAVGDATSANSRRVTLSVVPRGSRLAGRYRTRLRRECHDADRSQPAAASRARPRLFTFRRSKSPRCRTDCASGPCRHPSIPVVTLMLLVRRGAADDPVGKEGLAAITVDMLDEGSGDRSAIEIHEALARLGAQLDSDIGADAAVLTVTVAQPVRRAGADAARRHRRAPVAARSGLRARPPAPAAPADAAARHAGCGRRSRVRASALRQHPYGHTPLGSERSLTALTIDDVRAFHRAIDAGRRTRRWWWPATATTPTAWPLAADAFGGWNGAPAGSLPLAARAAVDRRG